MEPASRAAAFGGGPAPATETGVAGVAKVARSAMQDTTVETANRPRPRTGSVDGQVIVPN